MLGLNLAEALILCKAIQDYGGFILFGGWRLDLKQPASLFIDKVG